MAILTCDSDAKTHGRLRKAHDDCVAADGQQDKSLERKKKHTHLTSQKGKTEPRNVPPAGRPAQTTACPRQRGDFHVQYPDPVRYPWAHDSYHDTVKNQTKQRFTPASCLLCIAQGNFAEATPLFERSVYIKQKVFGPEHADVASSLNNLAMSLCGQVSALKVSSQQDCLQWFSNALSVVFRAKS